MALQGPKAFQQQGHEPFGLNRVDLEEGIGGDAEADAGKALPYKPPSRQNLGFGAHQGVSRLGLEVEADPHHLGPALQPVVGNLLKPIELVVAADQGDQDLAAVVADAQG